MKSTSYNPELVHAQNKKIRSEASLKNFQKKKKEKLGDVNEVVAFSYNPHVQSSARGLCRRAMGYTPMSARL